MKNRASQRGYTLWELIFTFILLTFMIFCITVTIHFVAKFW